MSSPRLKNGGTAEADRSGPTGFYGCARAGRGRVVRLAWAGPGRPPRSAELDCPACGETHRVALSWRRATALDRDREPELVLAGEEASS